MRRKTWYPCKEGDERIVTFFAWFPIRIENDWRWWENVTVRYRCYNRNVAIFPGGPNIQPIWEKIEFVEFEEFK